MILKYKNTNLELFNKNQEIDFDINKDVEIDVLREEFNDAISKLSLQQDSLEYWLMRLSERNTLGSHLCLDFCKIKLIDSLRKKCDELVVYTNNEALFLYYKKESDISFLDRLKFKKRVFQSSYNPYLSILNFLITKSIFHFKYVDKSQRKNVNDFTIIQTWVSDANFQGSRFKDSYYGDLASYLKSNKRKVLTWAVFYNVKKEKIAVEYMRKNDFLIIEDYLKFQDYLEAIKHFFTKRFLKLGRVEIGEKDFTILVEYYQKKESVEYVSLFYLFMKRLHKTSNENLTFIQNHENMIPQKALILGVKKYLYNSKVIGYFHTTKPKNLLCLDYANKQEFSIAPKPDIVLFNSPQYLKYFQHKYPHLSMYNTTAFKQKKYKNSESKLFCNEVLVLFSGTDEEIELLFDLLNSVKIKEKLLFRMHPMNRFEVKKYYHYDNYRVVNDENLNNLFSEVQKVISSYSATALEAALSGVNVGLVYSKQNLLLNPFDDTGVENYKLISNSREFEEFVEEEYKLNTNKEIFNRDEKYKKIFLEIT